MIWGAIEISGALGQFSTYRLALRREDPERVLYAVPEDAYETFFRSDFIQISIAEFQLLLIVYEPQQEIIVQWIS